MAVIKALEKLRECANHESAGFFVNLEQAFGLSRYKCGDSTIKPSGTVILNAIADKIEAEIDERFMALPLDADGVPIHVGDVMENEISKNKSVWMVSENGFAVYGDLSGYNPKAFTHANLRTLEDVLTEMLDRNSDGVGLREFNRDFGAFVAHYADEIRELMKEGGE